MVTIIGDISKWGDDQIYLLFDYIDGYKYSEKIIYTNNRKTLELLRDKNYIIEEFKIKSNKIVDNCGFNLESEDGSIDICYSGSSLNIDDIMTLNSIKYRHARNIDKEVEDEY